MVSDVDATIANTPKQTQREASTTSSQQSSQAGRTSPQGQPKPTQETYQAPTQPSGGSSAGKWLFGIAAVIGFIWLINQSDNSSSSKPAYSPGSPSTSQAPVWQPPATQPQAPSRPAEEKPPVGRNNVLSTAQIRYCLAEKIRLDAAGAVINNYIDSDVDRFNGYIDNYNNRCGEFLYQEGTLESARREVEPYRRQLQAEGRSRFVRSPSATTRLQTPAQTPQPAHPSPDVTVQSIQHRLNELGYDAGPADGLDGARTRNAISSFQRDNSIGVDGIASLEILQRLRSVESIGSENSRPSSFGANRQIAPSTLTLRVTSEEMQSIEMVCLSDKVNKGPAAYKNCVERHLASLTPNNRRPDLSGLSSEERQSIEMVCLSDKVNSGPAAYNRCIASQVASLGSNSRRPDLSRLSSEERQSIEMVCLTDKVNNGPAAYNKCIQSHLASLGAVSRRPDLSRLSSGQQQSIEMACLSDKVNSGPAAYNQCVERQLSRLGN